MLSAERGFIGLNLSIKCGFQIFWLHNSTFLLPENKLETEVMVYGHGIIFFIDTIVTRVA